MDTQKKELAKAAAAAAAKKVKAAYTRDRDHRVRLLAPFVVGQFPETFRGHEFATWESDKVVIDENRVLTILPDPPDAEPQCDGATFAPDKIAGLDIAPAYIPHDALYGDLDAIASDSRWRSLGWTRRDLRAAFDMVLGAMIRREEDRAGKGLHWVSRLYWRAVRLFGGIYHAAARVVVVAGLSALALGWAGGCSAIPDGFEPGDGDPVYEVIPAALAVEGG
ncbi:MAG: hypothetical protein IJ783_01635 [Kiritimatiellae bacterium]|nr:hypothetical protein [Kiritimatiellia bacterium]